MKKILIAIIAGILLVAFAFTVSAGTIAVIEKNFEDTIDNVYTRPFDVTDEGGIVHVSFTDGSELEFRAHYGLTMTKSQAVKYMLHKWDGTTA